MSALEGATVEQNAAAGSAVQLSALTKHYGEVHALTDVSLSLAPGTFLALLGPSGSGKSTLIRCLAGIERPTAGTISLGGALVASAARQVPPERRDLAMVFQEFALWPHMSVAENVRFALRRRRLHRDQARRVTEAMLDRVDLAGKADRFPHELSGGEQQRVALARALVGKPRLLLFDEPLSSLDAGLRERLRIEIGALVRESGATAVYITHDQQEAFGLGDEVGVMEAGRLVQIGPPETIYRKPSSAFVAAFTGLSGSLPGRLLAPAAGRRPDGVIVAVATEQANRLLEIEATSTTQLPAGAAVRVLLRPDALRICDLDAPTATLVGTVCDVAFCGSGYRCAVRIGCSVQLESIFEKRRLRRGERCGVALDPAGCHVFAEDPAGMSLAPLPADVLGARSLRRRARWPALGPAEKVPS